MSSVGGLPGWGWLAGVACMAPRKRTWNVALPFEIRTYTHVLCTVNWRCPAIDARRSALVRKGLRAGFDFAELVSRSPPWKATSAVLASHQRQVMAKIRLTVAS